MYFSTLFSCSFLLFCYLWLPAPAKRIYLQHSMLVPVRLLAGRGLRCGEIDTRSYGAALLASAQPDPLVVRLLTSYVSPPAANWLGKNKCDFRPPEFRCTCNNFEVKRRSEEHR